jgi:hypothetical protein
MAAFVWPPMGSGGGGGSPSGPAGGDLGGTFPNPTVPLLHQAPNTFAGFDASGNLYSTPWGMDASGQATGNFTGTLPVTQLTSLQFYPTVNTTLSGGYEGIIVGSNLSSSMVYTSSFNNEVNYQSGFNNSGDTAPFQDQANFDVGAVTQTYTSFYANPNLNGSITSGFTGLSIQPRGTPASPIPNVNGITIGLSNIPTTDPQGVIALNTDSRLSVNAGTTLTPNQGFQIGNRVESLLTVPNGAPVTNTDSLGNDFAGDLNAQDNLADGPTGGMVGWTGVGFISEIVVGSGKTVDTANAFLSGVAVPSPINPGDTDGGTVTNLSMIKTFPPLAEGGALNVTNIKALNVAGSFSAAATNAWGLYVEDTSLKNHIGGSLDLGTLTFNGSTSGTLSIAANPVTTPHSLVMPAAQGAAATVLTNDGAGNLSWAGGGITVTIITAQLTPATGTQGSMTFTNGILTAQTPAT